MVIYAWCWCCGKTLEERTTSSICLYIQYRMEIMNYFPTNMVSTRYVPACVEQRRTSWTSLEDHQWDIDKNRKATHREGEAIVHAPRGAVRYGSKRAGYERLSSGRAPNDRSTCRRLIHPLAPPCDGTRHPGTQHVWRRRPRMGHERRDTQCAWAAAGRAQAGPPSLSKSNHLPRGLATVHVRLPSAPPIRPGWVGA